MRQDDRMTGYAGWQILKKKFFDPVLSPRLCASAVNLPGFQMNHPFCVICERCRCIMSGSHSKGRVAGLGNQKIKMRIAAICALIAAFFGGALAFAVATKARRKVAHWSFVAGMLVLAVESVFSSLSLNANSAQAFVDWETCRFIAQSFLPGVWLFFSLSYARGNSDEFLARWRYALIASFLLPIGIAFGCAFWYPGGLVLAMNTGASGEALVLTTPALVLTVLFLLSIVVVLMNLERTFRASVGTMRWRIKFMVIGLVVLMGARAYTSSQSLLTYVTSDGFTYHQIDPTLHGVDAGALLLACPLILRSLMRSGHFEVNVYPSHKVIHDSIVLIIVGLALLVFGVYAKVAKLVGSSSFNTKAFVLLVGIVGVTVLLLSDRMRLYTKMYVSRHFQRPMYDYRMVWRRFTECTASRMDQLELCRATVKLVAEIFQALSVTMWLVDDKKTSLVFATSTSLSDAQGVEPSPRARRPPRCLTRFKNIPNRWTSNLPRRIGRWRCAAVIRMNFTRAAAASACR